MERRPGERGCPPTGLPRRSPAKPTRPEERGPTSQDEGREGKQVVRSPRNTRVRAAASLAQRRTRETEGCYLVEGPRFVADLLASGDIEEVFALPALAAELAGAAESAGARLTLVETPALRRLAQSVTPQGAVGVARQRRAELADVVGTGFLIVLCGVADPGNAGSAIRSAAAAGAAGVVLTSGSVDPWNPKAVRASAGAVARVPLVVDVEIDQVLTACRSAGERAVALHAASRHTIDAPGVLDPPVAMLFGNEAHGVPHPVLEALESVAIPRYGPVESLNLAAAVAVAAYAAARAGGHPGVRASSRDGGRRHT